MRLRYQNCFLYYPCRPRNNEGRLDLNAEQYDENGLDLYVETGDGGDLKDSGNDGKKFSLV